MSIEQIIEFDFKDSLGPFGSTCIPIVDYFYDKIKTATENLRRNYYVKLLKYCGRQCTLPPAIPGPNYLQNLTPKCKVLNVFWSQIVSKRRMKQFNFF